MGLGVGEKGRELGDRMIGVMVGGDVVGPWYRGRGKVVSKA